MTWAPKKLTREQQVERRQEGIRLLKKGQSQAEIARQLGVSPAAVCVEPKVEKIRPRELGDAKSHGPTAELDEGG